MSDLETRRQALGLSRKDASDLCGVSQGAIWSTEHGKSPRDANDPVKYESWLTGYEEQVLNTKRVVNKKGESLVLGPPGSVVTYEWEGLTPGDKFKVSSEEGTFTFRAYIVEAKGTSYIDCYGGAKDYGALRSFAPHRVVRRGRKAA